MSISKASFIQKVQNGLYLVWSMWVFSNNFSIVFLKSFNQEEAVNIYKTKTYVFWF